MFLNPEVFCVCVSRYGFVYFNEDVNIQSIIEVSGCLSVNLLVFFRLLLRVIFFSLSSAIATDQF